MRAVASSVFVLACVVAASGCGEDPSSEGEDTSETSAGESETGGGEDQECAPVAVPVLDGPGAQALELVATRAQIPGLADQPTAHGQTLAALVAFDGRLHLGYGDYDQNTGPIAMVGWDPALDQFLEFGVVPGEEVRDFIVAHGVVYGPALDHDGHQEFGGVYRLDCGADSWRVETAIEGAVHVYGLSVQGETLFAGTGSLTGEPALVMASTDRGASWTEVFRHESPPDAFSRVYTTAANSELLFVSGRELPSPGPLFAAVRHGQGAFEPVADPPAGTLVGVVLDDELVIVQLSSAPGFGAYLGSFQVEGQSLVALDPWPELPGSTLRNWTMQPASETEPEQLIVMMAAADGSVTIHRSADLRAGAGGWAQLASLDAPADDEYTALALLHNDLYLGTRAGSLWAVRELQAVL